MFDRFRLVRAANTGFCPQLFQVVSDILGPVANDHFERLQEELEAAAQALKAATDAQDRQTLLRKMRRLVEEADHLVKESLEPKSRE
jgi:acyl-CoA reductase-like NAD-dependent aldehyde dehydrogenase